jgi:hypothetical protein
VEHGGAAGGAGRRAVYIVSEQDLVPAAAPAAARLLAAVEAGATLLIPEFAPCDSRACAAPVHAAPALADVVPFARSPLLFHSPWWTRGSVALSPCTTAHLLHTFILLTYSVHLFLKRQCDQTPGGRTTR